MSALKEFVKAIPVLGEAARKAHRVLTQPKAAKKPFPGSRAYWEERYRTGDNSGVGSYGKFAGFKADVINAFVKENGIASVIELGCGDGNQLALANYPHYTGFDVSRTSIARCREMFAGDARKTFHLLDDYQGQTADLTLSLDVIYHLIEDSVFDDYMCRLFDCAGRFVMIYSSDTDENEGYENSHVRHRIFTTWIGGNARGWSLRQRIPNKYPYKGDYKSGSFSDFYIYEKID